MKKVVFIFLLFISFLVKAQPPSRFMCRYGANGYDVGYDVKQTLDGGYIIAGSTSSFGQGNTDFYLLKIDSMGQKKFEASFGGYSNEIAKGVVQLADSSYIIVGYTSSFGIGGYDIFLVKSDKNGNLLWQKTLGGSDWDFAYNIESTSDGGFIIGGSTYSFGYGNADGYVIKIDVSGNVMWSKIYGGKYDDEFKSVIQSSDGNYVLTGYTKSYNDSLGDTWLFKIDVNGDSLWSKTFGGNKEDFGNQIVEKNTELFIAGATASSGAGMLDACAYKMDQLGTLITTFVDGTAVNDEVYNSVAISKRFSVNNLCFIEKENFPGFKLQSKVIELDINLFYKNATDYGSSSIDETYKIVATKDKGYAIIGYTQGYGAVLTDAFFLKIDSSLVGGNFSIVSVNELNSENSIGDLFPNPTSGLVFIKTLSDVDLNQFHVFDVMGNEISISKDKIFKQNSFINIDLDDFLSGIYYLRISNATKKIVIKH